MTTSNLGRVAVVPSGTWAAGTYKPLSVIRYNGASYISKTTTAAVPTVTTDWDLIVGDGASLYTWIKYADDSVGTGLSDSPTGKTYIGFAANKSSPTESIIASDYTWSLIRGETGATGPQGPSGNGTVNSVAALTITTSGTDLTSTVVNSTTTPVITINVPNASATSRGVLSSTDWAAFNAKQPAISFGAGVQTFLQTPSSANLNLAITDETGSGSLVFATSPTLVTPTLNAATLNGNLTGGDYSLTRTMYKDTGWVYYNSTTAALDFTNGSQQRWAPTASSSPTLSITNWPPSGNLGELLIEGVNLGAAGTITWPTINWITSTGATTTTFSSNGVTLQTSGTDWCLLWTRDAGTTIYGKFVR